MPQRTLRFKIHQDGKVEETVQGFLGNSCHDATKNLENSLGVIKVKKNTAEAFIPDQKAKSKQLNSATNVTF